MDQLQSLMKDHRNRAFQIGDMVDQLVRHHKKKIKDIASHTGVSRQRLSEFRRTAAAFPPMYRYRGVDFHFHTIAARASKKLGIKPTEALDKILHEGIESTRLATRMLADEITKKKNSEAILAGPLLVARNGALIDQCHPEDCLKVIPRFDNGSAKIVFADAPYGQYGKLRNGKHTATASTRRNCHAIQDAQARTVVIDLLRLMAPKMAPGGVLILCRPGACTDPLWLITAIEAHGWVCARALTWSKRKVQLGRGDEPYGIASERLLVLHRRGDALVAHLAARH